MLIGPEPGQNKNQLCSYQANSISADILSVNISLKDFQLFKYF